MWPHFLAAFGLMLVFEGILPFLCPECWRKVLMTLSEHTALRYRIFGLISMLIGLAILYTAHHFLIH